MDLSYVNMYCETPKKFEFYVFSRTKTFCFENSVFSHLAYAYVKESEKARDVGKGESHSHP